MSTPETTHASGFVSATWDFVQANPWVGFALVVAVLVFVLLLVLSLGLLALAAGRSERTADDHLLLAVLQLLIGWIPVIGGRATRLINTTPAQRERAASQSTPEKGS